MNKDIIKIKKRRHAILDYDKKSGKIKVADLTYNENNENGHWVSICDIDCFEKKAIFFENINVDFPECMI